MAPLFVAGKCRLRGAGYTGYMKKLIPLLVLVLLLGACGDDGGSDTPEAAAAKFLEALQDGDQQDIYDSVVRGEAETFQKVDERLDYNRWDDSDIEDFKVGEASLKGNRMTVMVTVTREVNGKDQQSQEEVVCVQDKHNKKWKVMMSSSSPSFIPKAKSNR